MFSKRLRETRLEKGYTQEQIADYLGFTRPTYTAYESGRRKPDNDTLVKIAQFLEVSTDYLLGLTDIKDSIESLSAKVIEKGVPYKVETVAAHHVNEDWTAEELEDIERFKEFVRMKRQQRQQKE